MQSIDDLRLRLSRVRAKEHRVATGAGIAKTVLTLVGCIVLFFVVDYLFTLPRWGRLAILAVLVATVAGVVYRSLVVELRKFLDDDDIALRIEKRHPDLHGRLISTVQLARAGRTGIYLGSPVLIAALEAETIEVASPLNFLGIINTRNMVRFGVAACVVLAIAVASSIRWPEYATAMFKRIALAETTYPTRTLIASVDYPPIVARGDAVPVRVRLDPAGYIPEAGGVLRVVAKDGGELVLDMVSEAPGDPASFKGRIEKAVDDMTIDVRIDDAKRSGLQVKVLARPEISGGETRITSPEYTSLAPKVEPRIGDIAALIGSTVEIKAETTKKLKSAKIVRADGQEIPLTVGGQEGTSIALPAAMKIDKDTSYHFELVDVDGLGNAEPIEYGISAKPDQPPAVRIAVPNRDYTRTPSSRQPMRVLLKDDFGIRVAWIKWRIDEAQEVKELKLEIPPEKRKDRELELNFEWHLKELNLNPGQIVTYWIEADDFCTTNDFVEPRRGGLGHRGEAGMQPIERGFTRSQELKFIVVDGPTKWREILDMIEQASGRVRLVREQEEKTRDATGKAIETLKE